MKSLAQCLVVCIMLLLPQASAAGPAAGTGLPARPRIEGTIIRITYPRYLDRAVALSMRLADQAWASYGREPASVERILKQIDAESPFVTSFVMFDFFHYMSPCRGDAQKKLYDDYRGATRKGE